MRHAAASLRSRPWVWCGSRFVAASCVARSFPFDLPPVLFRLPAEVAAFPSLLRCAAVPQSFKPQTLLTCLQQFAAENPPGVGTDINGTAAAADPTDQRNRRAAVSDDLLPRIISVVAMLADDFGAGIQVAALKVPVYCPDSTGVLLSLIHI